jgi:hypothetical protein
MHRVGCVLSRTGYCAYRDGDPKRLSMNITGMLYGARLLAHVDFPAAEVLGPEATEDEIQGLIDRHKLIFIKPLFKGGVGKKGKSGLIGKASDLETALAEKERLYFVEHRHGNAHAKANGVTFEGGVPAEHDPRERFIAEFMDKRGDYNVFHAYYRELVQALYDAGATRYVFCVNVDAVIAALLLAVLWKDFRSGALTEKDLETAAFNVFLYGRMIGAAAEIDDHLNRGRNMDTRTPQGSAGSWCEPHSASTIPASTITVTGRAGSMAGRDQAANNCKPCSFSHRRLFLFLAVLLITAVYPVSAGLLRLILVGANGLSGHVAWIVMERSRLLFAGLLLAWILVVGHVNAPVKLASQRAARQWCMNNARRMMIGSGMPSSQRRAPLPKPI